VSVAAMLVAAGRGDRLGGAGGEVPKALVEVAGRTLLDRAITALRGVPAIGPIIIVHPPGVRDEFVAGSAQWDDLLFVEGGASRSASVRAGASIIGRGVDVVAIHDAARALMPVEIIRRVVGTVGEEVIAAAPGLPVADTLKRVGEYRFVSTVDRTGVWMVHTPQVIRRYVLDKVLAWAGNRDAPDDISLVEEAIAAGLVRGEVRLVPGSPLGFKITYPADLVVAEALVAPGAGSRTGSGIDVHAFDPSGARTLRLAGVPIEGSPGLTGHTDADVVAHAVIDALLGGAGLGDLGSRFGTDDPTLAGADSMQMLATVRGEVADQGLRPAHVDVTVVAEAPVLSPYRQALRESLATTLGIAAAEVSVKFTTTDGLGSLGQGGGVGCWATCLLVPTG